MPRVTKGVTAHSRHKKVLKRAKGYYGARSRNYKTAIQAVTRAEQNAYKDRKRRKRDFRKLWIIRINASARLHNLTYSQLIKGLDLAGVKVNRKVLAHMAQFEDSSFKQFIELARKALAK